MLQSSEGAALVGVGRGVLGIERDGAIEVRERVFEASEIVERRAAVVPGVGDALVEAQRLRELRHCLLMPAEMLEDEAMIVERDARALIELERARDDRLGVGVAFHAHERNGEQVERTDVTGLVLEEAAELSFGVREPSPVQCRKRRPVSVFNFAHGNSATGRSGRDAFTSAKDEGARRKGCFIRAKIAQRDAKISGATKRGNLKAGSERAKNHAELVAVYSRWPLKRVMSRGSPAASPISNILLPLPPPSAEEAIETLLQAGGVRVERIVSHGQASPEGFWYDQDEAEWVLVLSGRARLQIEGEAQERALGPEDSMLLRAHCRHRVAWTEPGVATVWLTIFIAEALAPRSV